MSSATTPSSDIELLCAVVRLLFETWDAATQRALLLLDKHNYTQLRHCITRVRSTTAAGIDTLPSLTHIKLLPMVDYSARIEFIFAPWYGKPAGELPPPTDLAPLAGCRLLQTLDLQDVTLLGLEPLAGLTHLHTLDLSHTAAAARDAAGNARIACMTRRRMVVVHKHPNQGAGEDEDEAILNDRGVNSTGSPTNAFNIDLSPLRGLTRLQTLRLGFAAVTSLEALTGLTQLEALSCELRHVSHLGSLAACTCLVHLNLDTPPDATPSVMDLAPLKGLHMLQTLSLADRHLRDLAPISELAQLRILILSGAKGVGDLRPIAGLARLQVLDLDYTRVHDLRPVAGLNRLSHLRFAFSPVQDIGPLAGLPSLESLALGGAGVLDIQPLLPLNKLRSLNYQGVSLDLAEVARLTQLVELFVGTDVLSISAPLTALASLEVLHLCDTRIADLAPLACLTTLKTLVIREDYPPGNVRDLAPLAALTRLQSLHVTGSQALRLDALSQWYLGPLSPLTRLTALHLNRNRALWWLRPLAGLTGLEELNLTDTPVSDIRPIAACTRLQRLWLGQTMVTQLGPIRALRQLQHMVLSKTPVKDLTPLGNLHPVSSTPRAAWLSTLLAGWLPAVSSPSARDDPGPVNSLQRLDLDETNVQDIAPLGACTQLKYLSLDLTAVGDVAPLASLSQLRHLGLQGTRMNPNDLAPLAGLTHLQVWWCRQLLK